MNFAIPFTRRFKYLNQDNIQLKINYKPKIKELDTFIKEYRTHRINLIFSNFEQDRDLSIILALKEKYPTSVIVICIPFYNKQIENLLNKNNFPHYYAESVATWERLQGFLQLNITDIFISDDLLFDLDTVKFYTKNKNIKIRCFCNVCQSSWEATPSLKSFFIRPEDLYLYEKYIDIVEFQTDIDNINTLYEIYAKDKKWFGKLNEIIINYQGEEDNRFIISDFGKKRLNCRRKCLRNFEPTCHLCERIAELIKTLKERNIMVTN